MGWKVSRGRGSTFNDIHILLWAKMSHMETIVHLGIDSEGLSSYLFSDAIDSCQVRLSQVQPKGLGLLARKTLQV